MHEFKVEVPKANLSGAVLIGVFLARSLGIGKIIDNYIGEEYVTYEHLREDRANGSKCRVSTGLACEIMIGDMLGIVMSWSKDEAIIPELEKTDGIFVLLTNHDKEKVDANELLTRYRGRNDIEISFRFLKGSLDLQQIFLRNPERVDAYCFLKVLAMLVLNLAAWLLAKNRKKMSPKNYRKNLVT